jgi:hypothetical protein
MSRSLAEKASLGDSTGEYRIIEASTSGNDEWLQGLGGDPYGGISSVGLRIPGLATTKANRYLALLASFSIPHGIEARLVGYRQLLTLGAVTAAPGSETGGRFVELEVTTPMFRLPDGNVSWHIQQLGGPNAQGVPRKPSDGRDLPSFKRTWADGPAILYEDYTIPAGNAFYENLTSYTPPNGGKPYGQPMRAGTQGTFYDLRTESRTHGAWHSLDMQIYGPCTVAFFASILQSNGASPAGLLAGIPNGLPEEQFIAAFSGVKYWRVGGSLIFEVRP